MTFKVAQLGWDADNFQLHLFAALAEKEREWIFKRTKDALAKKKANGGTLGNLASMPKAQAKSANCETSWQMILRKNTARSFCRDWQKENR